MSGYWMFLESAFLPEGSRLLKASLSGRAFELKTKQDLASIPVTSIVGSKGMQREERANKA